MTRGHAPRRTARLLVRVLVLAEVPVVVLLLLLMLLLLLWPAQLRQLRDLAAVPQPEEAGWQRVGLAVGYRRTQDVRGDVDQDRGDQEDADVELARGEGVTRPLRDRHNLWGGCHKAVTICGERVTWKRP